METYTILCWLFAMVAIMEIRLGIHATTHATPNVDEKALVSRNHKHENIACLFGSECESMETLTSEGKSPDANRAPRGRTSTRTESLKQSSFSLSALADKAFDLYSWASRNVATTEEDGSNENEADKSTDAEDEDANDPSLQIVDFLKNIKVSKESPNDYGINEELLGVVGPVYEEVAVDNPNTVEDNFATGDNDFDWYDDEYNGRKAPKEHRKQQASEKSSFYFSLDEISQVAIASTRKLYENLRDSQHSYNVVAAILLAFWLINVILFIGLWRVPQPNNTMWIRPPHDQRKASPPETRGESLSKAKEAAEAKLNGRGRPSPYDIGNITSTTEVGRVTPATTKHESDDAFVDKRGRDCRKDDFTVESKDQTSNQHIMKSGFQRQEIHSERQAHHCEGAAITVFDLRDRSKLPTKIVDLLACRRDEFCVHDHDRCRVVNNKLYIYSKPVFTSLASRCMSNSPMKISEIDDSSSKYRRNKKVSFSPVPKRRGSNRSPFMVSPSPGTESLITENSTSMPPPPRGYHVRRDPSSPETTSAYYDDDSAWNHTDVESTTEEQQSKMGIKFANAILPTPAQSKRSEKRRRSSPKRFTKIANNRSKKVISETKPKPHSQILTQKIVEYRQSAFGDFIKDKTINGSSDKSKEMYLVFPAETPVSTSVLEKFKVKQKCFQNENGEKLGTQISQKARLRHTRRRIKNANNSYSYLLNTNTNANSGGPEEESSLQIDNMGKLTTPGTEQTHAVGAVAADPVQLEVAADAEVAPGQLVAAELNTLSQKPPLEHAAAQGGDDHPEKAVLPEMEPDSWEAKRHTIMQACNQAIRNKLQNQQEAEEDELRDITTSDSMPSRPSSETRKRRKAKTTEAVCVKLKTCVSKKTTTTTTVKEIKQTSSGGNTKSLMLENEHQNLLSISTQSSEQSLSVTQPRHTRIVKRADLDGQFKKGRKLSSDTEVELLHQNQSTKSQSGASKSGRDIAVKEIHSSLKDSLPLDMASNLEDEINDIDKTCIASVSQLSLHQQTITGTGEVLDDCDKLSEKASAVTIIYVKDPTKNKENHSQEVEDAMPVIGESQELIQQSVGCDNVQNSMSAHQSSQSKERSKHKTKSHSSRHKHSKKRPELKIITPDQQEETEPTTADQLQSDTSLSHMQKASTSAGSLSRRSRRRSHSSPPDGKRKMKSSKKKGLLNLTEVTESGFKRIHKGRKRSVDKKRKPKALIAEKLRKTGSTSSVSSDKKRKSHTTASSISIDSDECDDSKVAASPPRSERTDKPEMQPEDSAIKQSEIADETDNQVETKELSNVQEESEDKADTFVKVSQISPPLSKKSSKTEHKSEPKSQTAEINQYKPIHKVSSKALSIRSKSQPSGKDLEKAELGWNKSIASNIARPNEIKKKIRKSKLKYVIVKAGDKQDKKAPEKRSKKANESNKDSVSEKVKQKVEVEEMPTDAQNEEEEELSLKGKTVQFSESIDKLEVIKQEHVEEDEESGDEESVQVGDNASEGSVGDGFLTDNFELVKDMVEEQPKASLQDREKHTSPKRQRRPMWLKKAPAKSANEEVQVMNVTAVGLKPQMSPQRLEKRRESTMDEVLGPKKCNIQVTNPLQAAGNSRADQQSVKTKVAYSTMLRNIFNALPLKKPHKQLVAQIGTPVDIKEIIEGSSVDAADYAKALKYPGNSKHPSPAAAIAGVPGVATKRKKGVIDPRLPTAGGKSGKPSLGESGSVRSLVSVESENLERRRQAPIESFSTDLDEAAVHKPKGANRGSKPRRKKEKRPMSAMMSAVGQTWQFMGSAGTDLDKERVRSTVNDMDPIHVTGGMVQMSYLNLGLSWLLQEFFNRLNFLYPGRSIRPVYQRSPEESLNFAQTEL